MDAGKDRGGGGGGGGSGRGGRAESALYSRFSRAVLSCMSVAMSGLNRVSLAVLYPTAVACFLARLVSRNKIKKKKKSETRMTAIVLKQEPNAKDLEENY